MFLVIQKSLKSNIRHGSRSRTDRDSAWKELLERYFREFLAFFFPAIERDIDWRRRPVFLEKELERILRRSASPDRIADKLARVRLRSGKEAWIFIHVEIHGRPEKAFPRRMYQCNYRIFDHHGREVVSVAVLTDRRTEYRGAFDHARWGFERRFRFPTVVLGKYRKQVAKLEADPNPFSLVVLAHLGTQDSRGPRDRLRWKVRLADLLVRRGCGDEDIMQMLRFIDWLIVLPRRLERVADAEIERLCGEKAMPYVTSWERRGIEKGLKRGLRRGLKKGLEKGLEKGREQGLVEAISAILEVRFGKAGLELLPRLEEVKGLSRLRALQRAAVDAESLAALAALLDGA
jgi:hypothetical protein